MITISRGPQLAGVRGVASRGAGVVACLMYAPPLRRQTRRRRDAVAQCRYRAPPPQPQRFHSLRSRESRPPSRCCQKPSFMVPGNHYSRLTQTKKYFMVIPSQYRLYNKVFLSNFSKLKNIVRELPLSGNVLSPMFLKFASSNDRGDPNEYVQCWSIYFPHTHVDL